MRLLRWAPPALADLARLGDFVNVRDTDAAVRVVETIRSSVRRLRDFPESGAPIGYGGIRKISVPRYRYIVFYHLVAGDVEVLRVRHAAEGWR